MGGAEQHTRGKSSVQTEVFEPTVDGRRIDALQRTVDTHGEWLNRLNPRMAQLEAYKGLSETSIGSLNEEVRLLKEQRVVPLWWLGACCVMFTICLLLVVIVGLLAILATS